MYNNLTLFMVVSLLSATWISVNMFLVFLSFRIVEGITYKLMLGPYRELLLLYAAAFVVVLVGFSSAFLMIGLVQLMAKGG